MSEMVVPDGWGVVKLVDLTKRVRGVVDKDPQHILTISSIQGWVDQRDKWARNMAGDSLLKYTKLSKGQFSYNRGNSKTFPQGCVFRLNKWTEAAVPNVYHSFEISSSNLNTDYLQQYFWSGLLDGQLRKVITSSARGNGLLNITADTFFNLYIDIPPLPEQQKIASILTSVDEVIEKTQSQINKLQDLKKGTMNELLTKGIGHTEFKDSPVGKIPVGWEVFTSQQLLNKKFLLALKDGNHGAQYPRVSEYQLQGIPLLSASNIDVDGKIDFSSCPKLSEERCNRFRIPPAKGGDIILTHNATVGRVGLIPEKYEQVIASTSTTYYRVNKDYLLSNYLLNYFRSPTYQEQLRTVMGQTTRNQVPITGQQKLFVLVPDVREQKKISEIITSLDDSILSKKNKLKQTQSLKKSLMQYLLTGKVRVTVH